MLTTLLAGCMLVGVAAPAWADDTAIRYRLQGDRLVMAPQKPAGKTPVKPAPVPQPAAATKEPVVTKARVAIIDFRAIGAEAAVAEAVTENLANAVVGLQCFTVLERSQIQQMIKEQAFGQSGLVDAKAAVSLGKLLGANIIVVGSVTRLGGTTTVNARFIDVQTAVAIDARNLATTDEKDLAGVVSQLAYELSNAMGCSQGQPDATGSHTITKVTRSKALATTLSVIVPGTGQFYGGNTGSGLAFLGLEGLGVAGIVTSLTVLQCNALGLLLFIPAALLTVMNTIMSASDAHANTPEELRIVH
jgi:TM2 domain-containing membrane protein YozV/TolB-like protein